MRRDRIYLTGYRGTGKTTVGKLISAQLSTDCVDLDDAIEAAAGKTIGELFEAGGEELFRDWETRCLRAVAGDPSRGRVVSLGGGAILRPENRQLIRETGICVWLTASSEVIAARIQADQADGGRRPALTQLSPVEEIQALLIRREPLYRQCADLTLATDDKSPGQLAADVIAWAAQQDAEDTQT